MKMINSSNSIATITALIKNAEEYVVLVSPYSDLKGWEKLKEEINNSAKRGIKVSYYVRKEEGIEGTEELDVNLYEVPNLHSKMFFSEKDALIGSAHLMYNEDINWMYKLDYPNEYNDIKDFFIKNIQLGASLTRDNI